jgi:carotenoid cleavage dioxygenase-like enzyme
LPLVTTFSAWILTNTLGQLRRYEINLQDVSTKIGYNTITKEAFEFGRINEQCQNNKYQFAYGLTAYNSYDFLNTIVKVDVTNGKRLLWAQVCTTNGDKQALILTNQD